MGLFRKKSEPVPAHHHTWDEISADAHKPLSSTQLLYVPYEVKRDKEHMKSLQEGYTLVTMRCRDCGDYDQKELRGIYQGDPVEKLKQKAEAEAEIAEEVKEIKEKYAGSA